MINAPSFLKSKRDIFYFLLLVAPFAALFIIIYKPLGVVSMMDFLGINSIFLYTATVVGVGFLILAISRYILYLLFQRKERSLIFCIIWIVSEVILLGIILTALAFSMNDNTSIDIPRIFLRIETDIVCILAIPTIILSLIFIIKQKNLELSTLQQQLISMQTNNTSTPAIDSQITNNSQESRLIKFADSAGKYVFSIDSNSLLYAESADNYVNIKYLKGDKLESHILHNTMKKLDLIDDNNLIRCHRYFMVNLNKVKVIRREGTGLKLQLEGTDFEIPVSKTYLPRFTKQMTHEG